MPHFITSSLNEQIFVHQMSAVPYISLSRACVSATINNSTKTETAVTAIHGAIRPLVSLLFAKRTMADESAIEYEVVKWNIQRLKELTCDVARKP